MAIFGSIDTVRAQSPQSPAFAVAWKYVDDLLAPGSRLRARIRSLKPGDSHRHELDSGIAAIEQAYLPRERVDGFFESHRRFVDIQIIVEGAETMEVLDLKKATVRQVYDPDRDLIVYQQTAGTARLEVETGDAAMFFPNDVHMPSLRSGANGAVVWKSVLKVPVGG